MSVLIALKCCHCQSEEVIRHGKSSNGKQRFRCLNSDCPYQTFSLDCAYPGRKREVKRQIVDMTLTCLWSTRCCSCPARQYRYGESGIKKKIQQIESVNRRVLGQLQPEQVFVEILRVQEAEDCTIESSEQGWNVELRKQ